MRSLRNLIGLCLAVTLFACAATTYIEKPAMQGKVPPAIDTVQPEQQVIPRSFETAIAAPANEQYDLDKDIIRDGRSDKTAAPGVSAEKINRFSSAYRHAGRPRIAVFFNRSLSDEVREWQTDSRSVVSGSGETITKTDATTKTVKGPVSRYEQKHLGLGGDRGQTAETDMWVIENEFSQPLLQSGAILIDRATILRLTASKRGEDNAYEPVAVKKIEMDALLNKADIFIEILLLRTKSNPPGFEYRAVAKEVKTGRILANVTSLQKDKKEPRKKIIASERGYEIVADTHGDVFDSKDGARFLAAGMMDSLATIWSRR